MKNKTLFGIFIISLVLLVGCGTINSESQATAKAEKYAENLWIKAHEDSCFKPPCEIMEHWVRTTDITQKKDYWIVTVEIERYNPEAEKKAKTAEFEIVRKVNEESIYVKKYFDVKVSKTGQISCLKATYPYNLFTPCEEKEE